MTDVEQKAFGVYVHWPFCLSKCPYCDFNSHVRHTAIDEERFARAFAREIETTAARVPGRDVASIFLGGGTPSLMQPQTVGAILDAIGKHWRVAPGAEVTLEANPTSVEATRFAGYRAAGVNRVSLGVQALDDISLKELGRLHSAREALDAVAIARKSFERYSFDLIYARPEQTPAMWADELKLAISEAAEHLSLYQLTIEEGTPFFGLHAAGKLKTPDEVARTRALRRDARGLRQARSTGLRDFQPRTRWRGVPAQSRLLARTGICRHRTRRAWPARHRRRPTRDRDRKTPRGVADAGRGQRPWRRHRRRAQSRGTRRRIPADGPAAQGRHRSRTLYRSIRPRDRSAADRRLARRGRDCCRRRRPAARDADWISGARCGGG